MEGRLNIAMRSFVCWSLLILLNSSPCRAQNQTPENPQGGDAPFVKNSVFYSASLGRQMHYRTLFPRQYRDGSRFPVLYLLHGLYGDYLNWDSRTHLEDYAAPIPLIIVMPDADDSWYTNSAKDPRDKFEDYVVKDLISEVDHKYRTLGDRKSRAIAGLSMGGYGAVKFGLKYPRLYAFVGSLSGALNAPQDLDVLRPEFRARLLEVFGARGSLTRSENDLFLLLNSPHLVPYPYFYLACGAGDSFLDINRAFVRQLSKSQVPYQYHETPGGHTWDYWDRALNPLLEAVEQTLAGFPAALPKSPAQQ